MRPSHVVFDFDGTLVDSDAALLAPFERLGVEPTRVPGLGLPVADACALAGVALDDYLAAYDTSIVQPFPGVDTLLARLDEWSVCSNKAGASARAELRRLGWSPAVAMFSEDFQGRPKELLPVLERLNRPPADVLFVGDTEHDRATARAAGVRFAIAGWNPRATSEPGDVVLRRPADLLAWVVQVPSPPVPRAGGAERDEATG